MAKSVPDTDKFSLQDVVDVVNPKADNLTLCFNTSTSKYFDDKYVGNKDSLLNFRNYGQHGYSLYSSYHHIRSVDAKFENFLDKNDANNLNRVKDFNNYYNHRVFSTVFEDTNYTPHHFYIVRGFLGFKPNTTFTAIDDIELKMTDDNLFNQMFDNRFYIFFVNNFINQFQKTDFFREDIILISDVCHGSYLNITDYSLIKNAIMNKKPFTLMFKHYLDYHNLLPDIKGNFNQSCYDYSFYFKISSPDYS